MLYQDIFKTSCKNVFKTSSRRLAKISSRRLQNVFKTSCEDIFKMSSKRLQVVLQRCLQENLKTYHQIKLFLLASLRHVFKTFLSRPAKTITYRKICLGQTSEKFMVSVQNFQRVIEISQDLVFHFTTPFSDCLQRPI